MVDLRCFYFQHKFPFFQIDFDLKTLLLFINPNQTHLNLKMLNFHRSTVLLWNKIRQTPSIL